MSARNKQQKGGSQAGKLLAGAVMLAAGSYGLYAILWPSEPEAAEATAAVVAAPAQSASGENSAPPGTQGAATSPVAASAATIAGPAELMRGPDYNDMIAAAQILRMSMDRGEAEMFVAQRMSVRTLRQKEEIAKLRASEAKSRFEAAEWESKNKAIESGVTSLGADLAPEDGELPAFGPAASGPSPDAELASSAPPAAAPSGELRVAGFGADGVVILGRGESSDYAKVGIGQTAWGRYRVSQIDTSRMCVVLIDERKRRELPAVCYQGV